MSQRGMSSSSRVIRLFFKLKDFVIIIRQKYPICYWPVDIAPHLIESFLNVKIR